MNEKESEVDVVGYDMIERVEMNKVALEDCLGFLAG